MTVTTVMGMETEYAMAEYTADGVGTGRDPLWDVLRAIARSNPCVSGREGSGLFLGNGARVYPDSGKCEYATPECLTPYDLVIALRAGERVMHAAARSVAASRHGELVVFRTNADYASGEVSWGCHESYLHRIDPTALPGPLIPHLVTRIVYTGAGGFALGPHGAGQFTLSPRAWFIEHAVSGHSTGQRGIYHTKDECLAGHGTHRLHVIVGESLCSDVGAVLKCGTTALIVAAIDAGATVGADLGLWSPVRALRTIASDPTLSAKVRLSNARRMTALEIQRKYLADVQRALTDGLLPDWAPEVCRLWKQTLDDLHARGTWSARALDWKIKRGVFERFLGSPDAWEEHGRRCVVWRTVCRRLTRAVSSRNDEGSSRPLREGPVGMESIDDLLIPLEEDSTVVVELSQYLQGLGLTWSDLREFDQRQRRLFELDLRFGQLDDRGIYAQLEREGCLEPSPITQEAILRAVTHPPSGGRAMARGDVIRHLHAAGTSRDFAAEWTQVVDLRGGRYVDLRDPLGPTTVEWKEREAREPRGPLFGMRQLMQDLF